MAPTPREIRDRLLADPQRPRYHFTIPEGIGAPFDPNGCIWWKGRYHLFYIFQDPALPHDGHCWGHSSSADLVHWVHHPTALAPADGDPEVGIFSGNALLNADGVPTIVYLGLGIGICIATADDDNLDHWTKCPDNPVIGYPGKEDPDYGVYNVHDPHCWLEADGYRVILNGKVLPEDEYDTAYLFRSDDLVNWDYVHAFYQPNPEWTGPEEDCACPDFFELGGRHMLLAISHARGARYYLGRCEGDTFHPEEHHRMNWPGGTCFAPESMLDGRGRRIMWAWALDRRSRQQMEGSGWSGTMTLPRVLSLGEDGALRMEPAEELEVLRTNHRRLADVTVAAGSEASLEDVRGDCLELAVELVPGDARAFGLKVRCSPDGREQTVIACRPQEGCLAIDVGRSSLDEEIVYRTYCMYDGEDPPVTAQVAPFELAADEPLRLRVFVDRSILEVFANGRQCLTQRIYPTRADSLGVSLFAEGGAVEVRSFDAWDMAPANPW